ncbi:MAG: hypothetical protein Q4B71_05820 [Cardiobacteriaceae bacterium]|nr:hypothetical protein [Cardiobacteriaceae bacterium]
MKIFTNSYAWNKEGIYHLDVKPARETLAAPHDCSKVYGFEGVKKQFDTSKRYQLRVAETEAQKNLRMMINSIWDSSITSSWNMNDKMVDLMGGELLSFIIIKSSLQKSS